MRYIVNNDILYFCVLYKAYIIEEVGVGGWKMFTWNRNAQIKITAKIEAHAASKNTTCMIFSEYFFIITIPLYR